MTNQVNQEFEKWNDLSNDEAYIYSDVSEAKEISFIAGHKSATQASESEINSLKERVEELEAANSCLVRINVSLAKESEELQADNTIMRDTLNKIALGHVYDADIIESAGDCLQRLCTTQSLAQHDNAIIDRCKNIVADDALAITFQSMGAYRSAIIKQIGELKAIP